MSFAKKVVTTYSKSLFQNLLTQSPTLSTYSNMDDSSFGVSTTETNPETGISIEKKSMADFSLSKIAKPTTVPLVSTIYTGGEELMLIRIAFLSCKKVGDFCKNPTNNEEAKEKLLLKLFPGLTVTMRSFLKVLSERSHISLLPEICEEFQKILLKYKKITQAKMTTGSILESTSGNLILNTLKKVTGSEEILFTVSYDPKLLGGFILEYNSVALDASILKEFSLFFNDI